MMGHLGRIGLVIIVALIAALVPALAQPAAACTPRTFRELGPAPNDLPRPEAPTPPVEDGTGEESTEEDVPPAEPPPVFDPWTVAPPPARCSYVYNFDFPIVGDWNFLSGFGSVRDAGERWHAGVDIAAKKLSPVVAVRAGTLTEVNRNGSGDCCWVAIKHDDGWRSLYIHLNNDTSETDDARGVGIVRGLQVGDRVERGQVIGYVGDSGNAEPTVSHIHFELRTPWLESVDPLPSLRRAARRGISGFADLEDPPYGHDGPFADDDGHVDEQLVAFATSIGLPLACDPYGLMWCPNGPADSETAELWIAALETNPLDPATHLPPMLEEPEAIETVEVSGSGALVQLQPEVLVRGAQLDHEQERLERICEATCSTSISRSDVALMLSVDSSGVDRDQLLDHVYSAGEVDGCDGTPTPEDSTLSRLGLLRMLMRAFGYLETPPCELIS